MTKNKKIQYISTKDFENLILRMEKDYPKNLYSDIVERTINNKSILQYLEEEDIVKKIMSTEINKECYILGKNGILLAHSYASKRINKKVIILTWIMIGFVIIQIILSIYNIQQVEIVKPTIDVINQTLIIK